MRRQRGFTLLEVIVVLTITGFLIVGIGQAVRFGITAWDIQGRLTGNKADLEAVDRTLRVIVSNLFPGDGSGRPPMTGSATALTGISRLPTPEAVLTDLPVEVGLALSGNRVVLRWRPYTRGVVLGAQAVPHEATLVEGVARLAIAYWQPSGAWTSSWNQPDLPDLIRLRVTFRDKGNGNWPDLVMAPSLSRP
jgi:general secretion pathway protein J